MRNITLNYLVFDFIELYRAHHKNTDSVEEDQVKMWINSTRAMLLKQQFDSNPFSLDLSFVQFLGGVTVEDYTVGTSTGVRTTYTGGIPLTINRRGGIGTFTLVSPPAEFSDNYEILTPKEANRYNNGIYNSNTKYGFISGRDNQLYIKNESTTNLGTTTIWVEGVFQNPELAYDVTGSADFYISIDYPIDISMYELMKTIILKDNFSFIINQIQDKVADGDDTMTNLNK